MRQRSVQFAIGLLLGFAASFVIAIAFLVAVVVVVLVVVVGLIKPRFAAFAGGALVGAGGTLLALTLNSVRLCAATADSCGDANFTGFVGITMGLVVTGVVLALWGGRRDSRARPGAAAGQ